MGKHHHLRGSSKARSFRKTNNKQAQYQQHQSSEAQIERKINQIKQAVANDNKALFNQLIQVYTSTKRYANNPSRRLRQLNSPEKQAFLAQLDNSLSNTPDRSSAQSPSTDNLTQSFQQFLNALVELYYSLINSIYQNHSESTQSETPQRQLDTTTTKTQHWQFYKPVHHQFNRTIDVHYQLSQANCPKDCTQAFDVIERLFKHLFIQPVINQNGFSLNQSRLDESQSNLSLNQTDQILDHSTKFLHDKVDFDVAVRGNRLNNTSQWHHLSEHHYKHFVHQARQHFHNKQPFVISPSQAFKRVFEIAGPIAGLMLTAFLFKYYQHCRRYRQNKAGAQNHIPSTHYQRFSFDEEPPESKPDSHSTMRPS